MRYEVAASMTGMKCRVTSVLSWSAAVNNARSNTTQLSQYVSFLLTRLQTGVEIIDIDHRGIHTTMNVGWKPTWHNLGVVLWSGSHKWSHEVLPVSQFPRRVRWRLTSRQIRPPLEVRWCVMYSVCWRITSTGVRCGRLGLRMTHEHSHCKKLHKAKFYFTLGWRTHLKSLAPGVFCLDFPSNLPTFFTNSEIHEGLAHSNSLLKQWVSVTVKGSNVSVAS